MVDLLERSIELFPERAWLLRAAGEKYLEIDEPVRALELFKEAVELEPEEGINRLLAGSALRRAGRLDEAEQALKKAGILLGEDPALNLELGKTYLARRQWAKAGQKFEAASVDWLGHYSLYDIVNDPGETRNIFLEKPRVAGSMLELERKIQAEERGLRAYYRGEGVYPPETAAMEEGEEEEMRRQLKLLGY